MIRKLRPCSPSPARAVRRAARGLRRRRGQARDRRAASVLDQTFGTATAKLDTGRLTGACQLDPEGLIALGGPIGSRSGPFAAPRPGAGAALRHRASRRDRRRLVRRHRARRPAGHVPAPRRDRDYMIGREFSPTLRKALAARAARCRARPEPGELDPQAAGERARRRSTASDDADQRRASTWPAARRRRDRCSDRRAGRRGLLTPKLRAADRRRRESVEGPHLDRYQDQILRQLTAFGSTSPSRRASRRSPASTAGGQPAPAPRRRQRDEVRGRRTGERAPAGET